MAGRILIADSIATNRILLKVKLSTLSYDVMTAASGAAVLESVRAVPPDLIVADMSMSDLGGAALCEEIRKTSGLSDVPIILLCEQPSVEDRIAVLRAGANGFIGKPIDHSVLQAKIRSLLRERDVSQGLKLRQETGRALGFAESQARFSSPGHVAFVSPVRRHSREWTDQIRKLFKGSVTALTPHEALTRSFDHIAPEVFVICATPNRDDLGLTLLSELRSRPETRDCGILVVVPTGASELASRALDQGASDLMAGDFTAEELVLRLDAQIKRKQTMDMLRRRIKDGLEAAVTDNLTGLPNRRYAFSHLASIHERCHRNDQSYAVMVLDLDRFKSVNDTYGHSAGDLVLTAFAKRMGAHLRSEDLLARIGGEEFLIAMPSVGLTEAKAAARRICRVTSSHPFVLETGQSIATSVSIGLTVCRQGADYALSPGELINRSDRALYAAKEAGRNQVQANGLAHPSACFQP